MISRQQIIRGQDDEAAALAGSGAGSASLKPPARASAGQQASAAGAKLKPKGPASKRQVFSRSSLANSNSNNNNNNNNNSSSKLIMSRRAPLRAGASNTALADHELAHELMMGAHCERDDDSADEIELDVQQDSSDGYTMNQYDDYIHHQSTTTATNSSAGYWRANRQKSLAPAVVGPTNGAAPPLQQQAQRQFDPYSIYSYDEEVWYSEERLFEDHLDEIYNKLAGLEDDIWCKLILMERNRRVGKSYVRSPRFNIDGTYTPTLDTDTLGLKGFDNEARDAETEDCRGQIGKGVRIKMDHYGNILIMRLSKARVFIKEWQSAELIRLDSDHSPPASRLMPSRHQLIKNNLQKALPNNANNNSITPTSHSSTSGGSSMEASQNDNAICDEILNIGGRLEHNQIYIMFDMEKFKVNMEQELCRQYPNRSKLEQQCFSIVGFVDNSNDVLNLPCWMMVINIVAIQMLNERFKLVSPEMDLSRRMSSRNHHQQAPSFVSIFEQQQQQQQQQPPDLHIANRRRSSRATANINNKEEDPYSLPANASSSDVKSSINDYGTTSAVVHHQLATGRKSMASSSSSSAGRYYDDGLSSQNVVAGVGSGQLPVSSRRAEMYANKSCSSSSRANDSSAPSSASDLRHRSKSSNNIYGRHTNGHHQPINPSRNLMYHSAHQPAVSARRYSSNNGSSIYSTGHMLMPPPVGDPNVPPKLPPRDFVSRAKSRSASSVQCGEDQLVGLNPRGLEADGCNEDIYSTRMALRAADGANESQATNNKHRKGKKNRFLESLKAPLELASSRSAAGVSGARSASVIGAASNGAAATRQSSDKQKSNPIASSSSAGTKTKSSTKTSTTKNLKSFLGVKSSKSKHQQQQQQQDTASDDSNYVHVDGGKSDPSDGCNMISEQATGANHKLQIGSDYNDLDIPTPDYETDENAYALEDNNYSTGLAMNHSGTKSTHHDKLSSAAGGVKAKSNGGERGTRDKSRFFASHNGVQGESETTNNNNIISPSLGSSTSSSASSSANNNNNNNHNNKSKLAQRDGSLIYGSTTGLSASISNSRPVGGSRYRSASMQRFYPSSTAIRSQYQVGLMGGGGGGVGINTNGSSRAMTTYGSHYDENPYAMGNHAIDMHYKTPDTHHLIDPQGHYGIIGASGGGGGHRRRSSSRLGSMAQLHHQHLASSHNQNNLHSHHPSYSPPNGSHNTLGSVLNRSSQYDIGRSSSGIYGNNSSSSSSDYADWQPQMRKVNSGGYLNSVFKSQLVNSSPMGINGSDLYGTTGMVMTGNAKHRSSNYAASRVLAKPTAGSMVNGPASHRPQSAKLQLDQQQLVAKQQQQKVAGSVVNGPTYRSYDSSNDSEPSYTNSSDGLDIYDHIGQQQQHQLPNGRISRRHQFLSMQDGAIPPQATPINGPGHHKRALAPEVHVGEWEIYDR